MDKESVKQAAKFSLVGIFNTLVDYGVFYVALAFLNLDKSIAQIFATVVAMCGSYIINKHWTFKSDGNTKSQIAKFILTNIVSMSCTIIFMSVFYDYFKIHEWANWLLTVFKTGYKLNQDLSVMLCKIAASMFSLVINFLGNKFWVFNKKGDKKL